MGFYLKANAQQPAFSPVEVHQVLRCLPTNRQLFVPQPGACCFQKVLWAGLHGGMPHLTGLKLHHGCRGASQARPASKCAAPLNQDNSFLHCHESGTERPQAGPQQPKGVPRDHIPAACCLDWLPGQICMHWLAFLRTHLRACFCRLTGGLHSCCSDSVIKVKQPGLHGCKDLQGNAQAHRHCKCIE